MQTQSFQADCCWARLVIMLVLKGPVLLLVPLCALCLGGLLSPAVLRPLLWLLAPISKALVLVLLRGLRGLQELLLLRRLGGLAAFILVLVLVLQLSVPLPSTLLPGGLLIVLQTPLCGEPGDTERRSPLGPHPTSPTETGCAELCARGCVFSRPQFPHL